MKTTLRDVGIGDWQTITEIFNHFVKHSLAAYPEEPVEVGFFRTKHEEAPEYPFFVAIEADMVVGFAYLSPFHPVPTMKRSASLTYFIRPGHTGQGLGTLFLDRLLAAGHRMGIRNFLAHISSANPGSIRFHERHGFTECGRFLEIGEKHGTLFDMVWMQRIEHEN